MKIKSNIIGIQVVINDNEDATVYEVVEKHPNAPSYLLAAKTSKGKKTVGWYDICYLRPATPTQIQEQLMSR